MNLPRILVLLIFLALGGCAGASWDPAATAPEPLELPKGMDPNSAYAYYAYGRDILERTPVKAAQAFYWASRIDPAWADPLYARRIALLMSRPGFFKGYLAGRPAVVNSPGVQRLDSLYLRALTINPFLRRQEDALALRYVIMDEITRNPAYRNVPRGDLEIALDRWLFEMPPATRAWLAQSDGRLTDAALLYQRAIERDEEAELVADLARVYVHLGRFQDAGQNMARAIELLHQRDEDPEELVRLYNSKALFEYSLGLILEQIGDLDEARSAYARALQEDLAYHPAHMRLGELALAAGDTVTALSEMALAADIQTADAGVLLRYGRLLAAAGQLQEAEARLRRAIEIEPLFADPHFDLARVLERADRAAEALAEYREFGRKASRDHPARGDADQRIPVLERAGVGGQ